MSTDTHIQGTIGEFSRKRIRTRNNWLRDALENTERLSQQWRGRKRVNAGFAADVTPPPMFRSTTKQTAGLGPFPHGNYVPRVGAPLGKHFDTGDMVGCDPLSWHRAGLITVPSLTLLSAPSAGKSSCMRVMMRGAAANGIKNIVVGDIKAEYVAQIRADEGNVVPIAPGRGTLNILDPGNTHNALMLVDQRLGDTAKAKKVRRALLADMHTRRKELVSTLVSVSRGSDVILVEETIIGLALRHLYETDPNTIPILEDLATVIRDHPTPKMLRVTNAVNDPERYQARVDNLLIDLASICESDDLGEMFNGHTQIETEDGGTTSELNYDNGLVFDLSGIHTGQTKVMAAAYLATWIVSFGLIETSHILADYGLAPREHFIAWMDEFWQPLAASKGIVKRTNKVGRTNRTVGVGLVYAMHTLDDLETLPDVEDRNMARGIVRRCGMQLLGGMPGAEIDKISEHVAQLSNSEYEQLKEWHNPAFEEEDGWIPGRGCFLAKRGDLSTPIRVLLTQSELDDKIHDTSQRLHLQDAA